MHVPIDSGVGGIPPEVPEVGRNGVHERPVVEEELGKILGQDLLCLEQGGVSSNLAVPIQ